MNPYLKRFKLARLGVVGGVLAGKGDDARYRPDRDLGERIIPRAHLSGASNWIRLGGRPLVA